MYVQLKGLVNVEAELEKLDKQLGKIDLQLKQLEAKMSIPNYETRVPEDVREANQSKVDQALAEKEHTLNAIKDFKALQ